MIAYYTSKFVLYIWNKFYKVYENMSRDERIILNKVQLEDGNPTIEEFEEQVEFFREIIKEYEGDRK